MSSTPEVENPRDEITGREVDQLLKLIDGAHFDNIEIEWKGFKLHLSNGALADRTAQSVDPEPRPAADLSTGLPGSDAATETAQVEVSAMADVTREPTPLPEGTRAIKAPTMGAFYRCPEPGMPPFVEVGAHIETGETLGLVEVMKVFSAITAETPGTVKDIRATDGAFVEYGEVLFVMEDDG